MSVDEFKKLLPKVLIDAAYALPAEMGDFVWRSNEVKKVLASLVEKKRMIAGGEIWKINGSNINLTWQAWDYGLDKISQVNNPEKWYKAAVEGINKYHEAYGDDYLYSVILFKGK